MNEEIIADFKQFIAGLFAQQTAQLKTELRAEWRADLAETNKKIDDLADFMSEAITTANEAAHAGLKDHERRIVRLERRAV